LLDREQLETFAAVAELQGFERAAGALHITRGAVSQRVKALEQALATVLLVREKPVVPTPAGEILLRHVQALRLLEGSTLRELDPAARSGAPVPLAIALNADSLATWFPALAWPLLRERGVALEVVLEDLDHTRERLVRGQVVGCVSSEPAPVTGFVAQPLGAMEYRCYASPSFAAEFFPAGLSVAAALRAPALLFDRKDSLHERYLAQCFGFAVDGWPRHLFPSPATLIDAIEGGIGYGMLPGRQAASRVAGGVLVELEPHVAVQVDLYWHHWEYEPPLCRELTRRVIALAGQT
jgi:LysR family transcriptional regulator (chromosome initiation inhibitor)